MFKKNKYEGGVMKKNYLSLVKSMEIIMILAKVSNECRRMTVENKNIENNDSKRQLKYITST